MGELGLGLPNGGAEQRQDSGLGWESFPPLDPASLREECLSVAEEAAQQVLSCIHPTLDSEEKRRDIIDYVQRLIKSRLDCEVFPYGSVPLKTYLPDGDIDLTAINGNNANESLAHDVLALLQREENFVDAEFKVTDTQYIDAEVKLVKCLVQNTIIDLSFNQLGGLSTLCFMEQVHFIKSDGKILMPDIMAHQEVDRLVGRNHLFKRSIILIKTWCYYESRILGAQHGLISTYALETLVLYIFHFFSTSLCGPLTVLYRFLDYFSKFDWENYCISLKGPVCKSSLPDIVVKVPENGWTNLMFSEEFLENCREMFSVSSRELEGKSKPFLPKHLNIIDLLKESNNLGRSVHIGNFYRIRYAFKYGSRKLSQILSLPSDKVSEEIHQFFSNALARHGNENRNIIQHWASDFGDEKSSTASLSLPVKAISEENMLLRSSVNDNHSVDLEYKNEKELPSKTATEGWYPIGVNLGHHVSAETYDVIISNSCLRNGSTYHASRCSYSTSISWNNCREPLCVFSKLSAEHGILETGNVLKCNLVDYASQEYGFESCLENNNEHDEVNHRNQLCMESSRANCTTESGSSVIKSNNVDGTCLDCNDTDLTIMGESEAFNPLADLTGDYDSHIRSLLYGQLCHGFSLSAFVRHPSSRVAWSRNKNPCKNVCRSMPFCWSRLSQTKSQPILTEQFNCRTVDSAPTSEEQKAQGNRNDSVGERHPQEQRARKKVSGFTGHNAKSNGANISSGMKDKGNSIHEEEKGRSRSQHQTKANAKYKSPTSNGNENGKGNGNQTNDDSWKFEFGSIGNLAQEVSISCSEGCDSPRQERFVGKPIHLKSEAEFPPLS